MTAPAKMPAKIAWRARPRWQRIAIVVAIALIVIALALWIASIVLRPHLPSQNEVVAHSRAQAELAGGAQVFVTHCAYCHDRGISPRLGGRGLDGPAIKAFVRTGPGAMPAFPATVVSDADIEAVAKYLTTLQPAKEAK